MVVKFIDVAMADNDTLALVDGLQRVPFRANPDIPVETLLFSGFVSLTNCQMAKLDPFLSLDCANVEGVGVQSKEGRDQILQRSVAEP